MKSMPLGSKILRSQLRKHFRRRWDAARELVSNRCVLGWAALLAALRVLLVFSHASMISSAGQIVIPAAGLRRSFGGRLIFSAFRNAWAQVPLIELRR